MQPGKTSQEQFVFVGGPRHGEVIVLPGGVSHYRVPRLEGRWDLTQVGYIYTKRRVWAVFPEESTERRYFYVLAMDGVSEMDVVQALTVAYERGWRPPDV